MLAVLSAPWDLLPALAPHQAPRRQSWCARPSRCRLLQPHSICVWLAATCPNTSIHSSPFTIVSVTNRPESGIIKALQVKFKIKTTKLQLVLCHYKIVLILGFKQNIVFVDLRARACVRAITHVNVYLSAQLPSFL